MLSLCFRFIWFIFFWCFLFQPNDPTSCQRLCLHIQGLGICAIKTVQWFYNVINFKYGDGDRPLFLEYIYRFQTFTQSTMLGNHQKQSIMIRLPIAIKHIEEQPMAAGSIGQIHKCYGHDGTTYIIKMRHDGVGEELENYARLFRLISWVNVFVRIPYRFSELIEFLRHQIDFTNEARNMTQMQKYYDKDSHCLRIPRLYYSSPDLLLMEYIPSIHGPTSEDGRYCQLMRLWLLDQILLRDISHGDIHYGNWGFNRDHDFIVMYDLGTVTPTSTIRNLVMQCLRYNKEGIYREICLSIGHPISQAKFDDWWVDFVANYYCFTIPLVNKILQIICSECSFNVRLLYMLNAFSIFTIMDQYTYMQRIHHLEMKKNEYALLRAKKTLPDFQRFLWNNFFLKRE